MRIFLIGFMGSGKTYCGRRLAEYRGMPFLDLDQYIEQQAGMTVSELFAQHGEGYFRELERGAVVELSSLPSFIMATGGGTPCHHQLIDHLNAVGTTVFLDPSPELLFSRLRPEIGHRPLLAGGTGLESTVLDKLRERRPCYERASIHLRFDDPSADLVRLISEQLPPH